MLRSAGDGERVRREAPSFPPFSTCRGQLRADTECPDSKKPWTSDEMVCPTAKQKQRGEQATRPANRVGCVSLAVEGVEAGVCNGKPV